VTVSVVLIARHSLLLHVPSGPLVLISACKRRGHSSLTSLMLPIAGSASSLLSFLLQEVATSPCPAAIVARSPAGNRKIIIVESNSPDDRLVVLESRDIRRQLVSRPPRGRARCAPSRSRRCFAHSDADLIRSRGLRKLLPIARRTVVFSVRHGPGDGFRWRNSNDNLPRSSSTCADLLSDQRRRHLVKDPFTMTSVRPRMPQGLDVACTARFDWNPINHSQWYHG